MPTYHWENGKIVDDYRDRNDIEVKGDYAFLVAGAGLYASYKFFQYSPLASVVVVPVIIGVTLLGSLQTFMSAPYARFIEGKKDIISNEAVGVRIPK